jgi:hypothetical protein
MGVLTNTYLNLIDVYKRSTDQSLQQIAAIIEMLNQSNPILDDAVTMEANMGTIHRHMIRTGLPSVTWGRLYQGIPQSKSATQQVDDTTGWIEGMNAVDTRLLKLAPNGNALRLSEVAPMIEAMNQEMARGIFYHDTATTPEKFKGLAARYNTIGGGGAGNQIVDGGGLGSDNTSVWFVTWADHATHLIHPKGTPAGVQREDKGEQRVTDASGNPYFVKEEVYSWHLGLAVKDWRYNARIANIDVSDMLAGSVDLYGLMRKAYYKLQSRRRDVKGVIGGGRIAIYANRDVIESLDALTTGTGSAANAKLQLQTKEIEGKEVLTFRGIPIRETDALLNTEARVV